MSEGEIATRKHTRQRLGCCKARHIRPASAVSLITLRLPGQQHPQGEGCQSRQAASVIGCVAVLCRQGAYSV